MILGIMGILTLVTMPSLVKSIRGNRLRVGARTIVLAGNYARTMAILKNQNMKLTLDKSANQVSVEPFQEESPPPSQAAPEGELPDSTEPTPSAPPPTTLCRQLDAVRITQVTVDHLNDKGEHGPATVVYRSNGRCTPYEVHIEDEFGSVMVITVDAVASPKVKKEGE